MRVLTISTVPFGINGITKVIKEFFYNISSKYQMDFVFIGAPDDAFLKDASEKGSRIYILENRNSNPFVYMKKLSRIIQKNNYDIVHIHGNSRTLTTELYVCKRNKIKNRIVHAHSTSSKHPILHKRLKRVFEKLTHFNLSVSKEAGQFLFDQQYFHVLPNGFNVKKYKYNENMRKSLRNKLLIKDDEIVIGHVGELNENKNQRYLINLIENLSKEKYKLILIGEGEDRTFLEKEIVKKGLDGRVHLLGKLDNVHDWLNVFDFFVFPSQSEGLGLAIIEAQANGLKCYVSDTIPEEVNVTNTLESFSLYESSKILADRIKSEKKTKARPDFEEMYKKIFESDFNIDRSIKKLESYYEKLRVDK